VSLGTISSATTLNSRCPPPPESPPVYRTRSQECTPLGQTTPLGAVPAFAVPGNVSVLAEYFYAGDLLWTLENGPVTTSIEYPRGASRAPAGGTVSIVEENDPVVKYCPSPTGGLTLQGIAVAAAGMKCFPREVTVSVPENKRAYAGLDFIFDCMEGRSSNFFGPYPLLAAGDVVCEMTESGCLGARWRSPLLPSLTFPSQFPFSVSPIISLEAFRPNWCDEIDTATLTIAGQIISLNVSGVCASQFHFGPGQPPLMHVDAAAAGFSVDFGLQDPLEVDFSPGEGSAIITSKVPQDAIIGTTSTDPASVSQSVWGGSFSAGLSAEWGGVRSQEIMPFGSVFPSLFTDYKIYFYPTDLGFSVIPNHPFIPGELFRSYAPPASITIKGYGQCTLANSGGSLESNRNGTVYAYYRSSTGVESGGIAGPYDPAAGLFGFPLPRQSACVLVLVTQPFLQATFSTQFLLDTRTLCDLDSVEVLPNPSTGQIPFWVQNIGFLDSSVPKSRRVVKFTIPPTPIGGGPAGAFGSFTIRIHSGSSFRDVVFSRNN